MLRCLSSLATLVTLTFALMIVPVAAQNSTLTPELLSKMLDEIARNGTDRDVPVSIANPLGLTVAGQRWASREFGLLGTATGILHAVYISRGTDKDLMLVATGKEKIDLYRIHRDGTLMIAAVYNIQTQQVITRDRAEAQKGLEAELVLWSTAKLE